MSTAPRRAGARIEPRLERLQPWLAALGSLLVHVLAVLLLLASTPVPVTSPQGASSGSRMVVDFIGIPPPQTAEAPPSPPPPTRPPVAPPPAASRLQTTRVERAELVLPPERRAPADVPMDPPRPAPQPAPPQAVPPPTPAPAQAQAASPPSPPRRDHTWGQPPGMLPTETAPVNAGMTRSPTAGRTRGRDSDADHPSLEVGGYQVYYDLRSETRLQAWRDQGMTEVFLPLPGTRKLMACPLETALRRDSGPCRLLDPEDPAMAGIGDAREVINMQQVYRRGEPVWRGPGPYR
ncbi:type II toxin-antitoxin system RelE/ParE family toxin [Luteimonas sp. TWI1416]|uniref:type II toxin-antitoxin system RelE/ParE family toxin n=1 Tax=unclassified Luteimonas TaxID=2629088 RepID=UPI0032080479